ncbi:MAG: hypothetical protein ABID87_02770 [Chloroflexota bacterium]
MSTEDRITALEEELQETKSELQHILLDIRTLQMEAQTPLPADARRGKMPVERERQRGVKTDGNG